MLFPQHRYGIKQLWRGSPSIWNTFCNFETGIFLFILKGRVFFKAKILNPVRIFEIKCAAVHTYDPATWVQALRTLLAMRHVIELLMTPCLSAIIRASLTVALSRARAIIIVGIKRLVAILVLQQELYPRRRCKFFGASVVLPYPMRQI
jgi:hypothetical protein